MKCGGSSISVIVSTYNTPWYLDLVLDGLARQTDQDFECIVADDGSTPETAVVVRKYRGRLRLAHSWQVDRGFRLAASRNQALALACGEIAVLLDGDCIPSVDYVADIRAAFPQSARVYLQGHRAILGPEVSASLVSAEGIFSGGWIWKNRSGISNLKNALRYPFPSRAHLRLGGVRGCSMAFRTSDLRAVNGFDEEFVGWGHEDKDLVLRLFRSGVRRIDLRGRAVVYHLYHEEHHRGDEEENLRRALGVRPVRAKKGLSGVSGTQDSV